jgi:phosphoribosylformylglycinamidine cyclo-ligase
VSDPRTPTAAGTSYRDAGVDLDAARRHTEGIARLVTGGVTGFAGVYPLPPMRDPLLVGCTDGVGTKVLLAQELGRVAGLGQDLVAMCVNDLVCTGARPLFFLDYLAVGRLDPEEAGVLVGAIAEACAACSCALLGGETAEMPGLYAPGHFDLAGFAVGAVERDALLGPHRVEAGDVIVGIGSSGLHSNGYSLVRRLVADGHLARDPDLLLAPTRLYTADVARLQDSGVALHGVAHITGGGLPENLPRAIPEGLRPVVDRAAWPLPPAVAAVVDTGQVDPDECWSTFNMGLGMCLVVPQEAVAAASSLIEDAHVVGWVEQGPPGLRIV